MTDARSPARADGRERPSKDAASMDAASMDAAKDAPDESPTRGGQVESRAAESADALTAATAFDTPQEPEAGSPAHVLVIDDDARIRGLLKKYLQQSGFLVSEAEDAARARRLVSMFNFDILIVDVMMPGESGLSFTTWIDGRTPVLLLTARGETEARIEGLEAGADDYLAKPFEPKELKLRIAAILRRAQRATPAVPGARMLKLGAASFDVERGELWRGDEPVRLTTAEATLLKLLARRANEAVSRLEMLTELGGAAGEGAESVAQERAIDVQITRLRRKVEPSPKTPRFIKTVRGAGYMLSPEAEHFVEPAG